MSITNGYATLAQLKSALKITNSDDDDELELAIESASRMVDEYTNRRFYTTEADETRYYAANRGGLLLLDDDLLTITSLKTDDGGDGTFENTWTATDYHLLPYNASADSQPYTSIEVTPYGNYTFPVDVPKSVQIIGTFGYASSAPTVVQQACLIQAGRLYRRKDAPFGVMGAGEFGQGTIILRLDPDVRTILDPYRRVLVA